MNPHWIFFSSVCFICLFLTASDDNLFTGGKNILEKQPQTFHCNDCHDTNNATFPAIPRVLTMNLNISSNDIKGLLSEKNDKIENLRRQINDCKNKSSEVENEKDGCIAENGRPIK
jgi:hypothetical protein